MGTRCITQVQDHGRNIVEMYRQMDGYPDGHGEELASFLRGKRLINGIPMGRDVSMCFNGLGCLAASLVAHFKTGIGSFYLQEPAAPGEDPSEYYVYTVYQDENQPGAIKLRVKAGDKIVFDDYADAFTPEACREDEDE